MKKFNDGDAAWILVGLENRPTVIGLQSKKILITKVDDEYIQFQEKDGLHCSSLKHSFHTRTECLRAMQNILEEIKDDK